MKRFALILISIMLLAAMMVTPVTATEGSPAAAFGPYTATGTPGSTVSVTLNLSGFANATSMGIQVSTESGLVLNTESCSWAKAGVLMNFSGNNGVWAAGSETDINGAVATLVFTVPTPAEGQTDMDYNFSCTVQAMNGSEVVGSTAASGIVRVNNPATGLTLDKSSLSLDMNGGATAVLTATVTPANTSDAVVWSSSDSAVVTVSNGTVTAKKPGTATITVTAGSKSASCAVTVTCSHNLTEHAKKAPTCQATGNNLYYTCNACGVVLDSNKAVTTVEAQTLAKVSHSGGTATCTAKAVCSMCSQPYGETLPHDYATVYSTDANNHWYQCKNCTSAKDSAAHSFEWVVDVAATGTTEGKKHEECKVCHFKRNENTVIPHTHSVTKHNAVAATCAATGNVEYWTCSSTLCAGKYYGNAECTKELTTVTLEKNPSNHTGQTELRNVVAATCGAPGYSGDTYCKGCNAELSKGTTVPATGIHTDGTATCTNLAVCTGCNQPYGQLKAHSYATAWSYDANGHWKICTSCNTAKSNEAAHTLVWITDKAPTEDATGLSHQECSCGYKTSQGTVIEKLPHTHVGIQRHAAVAATCTTTGNVEYWTCSSEKCKGLYYGDENCYNQLSTVTTAINEDNHVATELRNVAAPSCYQPGYTGDVCCKACGDVITAGSQISATGAHVAGTKWYTDAENHWHVCTTKGCTAVVDKKAHSFSWVVDKEATEDATGLKHEECACGYKRSENTEIPKLDHVHVGIKHYAAVPATCVKAGTVEYWTCSSTKCAGKFYGDAKCQTELTTNVEVVNPDNHVGATELKDKLEPTCVDVGYTGDTWCTSCKAMVKKGEEVPATGIHTPAKEYQKDDKVHWQTCSHCKAIINNKKVEHTYTWVFDKRPTEQAAGVKHQECTACGHKTSENTAADKLKHTPVRVEGKLPTCEEEGLAEHFFCKNCGSYYLSVDGKAGKWTKKADLVLAATGHIMGTEWVTDENNHWHSCTCDEIADEAKHEFHVVGAVEATETQDGYTGDEVCAVCEYVKTTGQVIPCVPVEETEPPVVVETEPVVTEPQETEKGGSGVIWVAVLAAAAGAVGIPVVLHKKKVK